MWSPLRASSDHRSSLPLEGGLDGLPLRASNEGLPRLRVARATEVGALTPPSLPFCFRRRPIQFRVTAAVGVTSHGDVVT